MILDFLAASYFQKNIDALDYKIKLTNDFITQFYDTIKSGEMNPIIDSQYDWIDVSDAHRRMESNLNAGKIILNIT